MYKDLEKCLLLAAVAGTALFPAAAKSDIFDALPKGLFSETPYKADLEPDINLTAIVSKPKDVAVKNNEIEFSADEIETDTGSGIIKAKGNVEIVRDDLILKADEIVYNQKEDIITANGNISLLEASGNMIYAENVNLEDKMDRIDMENIKVVLKDQSHMAARSFRKYKNDNKLLENVVYSPCDLCEKDDPLWQIKARKVRHNAEMQDINYNDAFLEIKGVPIMYMPFFSHPDPSVKRRSGVLPPSFNSNNYFGARITGKYFWSISDNESVLISPGISSKIGPILSVDYDKYVYNGELRLSGSYLKDNKNDDYGNGDRGSLYLSGRYEINDNWVADTDFKYVSDRTFLKDMSLKEKDDAWLNSVLRFQGFFGRNYASIETYYYKQISYDLKHEDKPFIVPLMMYEHIGETNKYGFYNKNEFSAASIYREEDDSSYRTTMINSWILPSTTSYGAKTKLMASIKTDFYYIDNYTNQNQENFDGGVARVFPQLSYEWRLPFVKASEYSRQIIEPIVVAALSPDSGGKENEIPNNDSRNPRLDDTNVLDVNRYAGYDINDSGSRISYGVNWSSYGDITGRSSFLLAQSYKFERGYSFSEEGEEKGYFSDYIGRLYANPHKYVDFNYRFIVDREDYELEYSELSTKLGSEVLNTEIAYIYLKDDNVDAVSISNVGERKELYMSLNMALAKYWSLSLYNRQDLTRNGGSLEHGGSLIYEDECLILSGNIKKDNSNDPQYKGSYEFSVDFFLKTLGGVGAN
ncbi:MAG: LPS assembly protein LptD [Lactobacillaceae bacterium]|jgi:LPS-assembly protein|nr:LPS assembly protein LptD [Lactobacillaceae bacterium]